MAKEDEYREIFLAEAQSNYEELNRYFVNLEKNHADKEAIAAIFRITHTLKANAAALGYEAISEMAHLLEDIFSEIKNNKLVLTTDLFNDLFRANDKLGEMIDGIKDDKKVSYVGLKTKLKVILNKARQIENPVQEALPSTLQNHEITEEDDDKKAKNEATQIAFSEVVQVPVNKLDNLLNLVGELSIEKDRILTQSNSDLANKDDYGHLSRITSDLQYSVMGVRLVQVSLLFNKFHRIVRDIANLEEKKVNLVLEGTDIEIDRNILQIISDSLIHLVRNAIGHGIENMNERTSAGKSPTGTLTLKARNDKDYVVISVVDDGKGIDPKIIRQKVVEKNMLSAKEAAQIPDDEIIKYIFESGFTSMSQVTAISGRGVGMDVVKRATESVGGRITLQSQVGKGTTFNLLLPTSMAVKSVLLFELNDTEFGIPLLFTEAVVQISKSDIHKVGKGLVTKYLEKPVSLIYLDDIFGAGSVKDLRNDGLLHQSFDKHQNDMRFHIILVSVHQKMVGFVVDKLLQQKEIIEKPLSKPLDNLPFISGATILGNGNVCLILDVISIIKFFFNSAKAVATA